MDGLPVIYCFRADDLNRPGVIDGVSRDVVEPPLLESGE